MVTKQSRTGLLVILGVLCMLCLGMVRAGVDVPRFYGYSYIDLGTPDALQLPANAPFTIEAWVRVEQHSDAAMVCSKNAARGAPYTFMFGLRSSGTKMSAYTGAGGSPANTWRDVTLPTPPTVRSWHHLAYSYDGANISFFFDGGFVGSAAYSYGINETHTAKIGGYSNRQDLQGNIADVRVWDHARSAVQIETHRVRRLRGNEPGLLGYWPLDEGSGTEVYDRTVNANTGTLVNVSWTTEDNLSFTNLVVAHPVTGSTRFSGTNELAVVSLPIPDGYGYYQITTSGLASAIVSGGWISTSVPPANVTFDWPVSDTHVTFHSWFTNSVSGTLLYRDQTSIVYTEGSPEVAVRPTLTRERLPGQPVMIQGIYLDNGSTGGMSGETPLDVFAYRAVAVNPADDLTPEAPYVTLASEGTYPLLLEVMNEAGQVVMGVETCQVTVVSYGGTNIWTGDGKTDLWSDVGNWSVGVPAAGQDVAIRSGNGVRLTEATAALNSFEMSGGSLIFSDWMAPLRATNVAISGGVVTCASDFYASEPSNRVWIVCSEDFLLTTPGTIDVSYKGYIGSSGPGKGADTSYGTGGGHGGQGGFGYWSGGRENGSLTAPDTPGSGGGVNRENGLVGGSGGGVVRIEAGGTVDIRGTVAANGQRVAGGGGAGGSIYVTAAHFTGNASGLLQASGGHAGSTGYGGGGGGGRIAIDGGTVSVPLEVRMATVPGKGDNDFYDAGILEPYQAWTAGWGTLYIEDEGILSAPPVDHQYDHIKLQVGQARSWTMSKLTLTNNYVRLMPEGFQLNVDGDLTVGARAHLGVEGSISCGGNLSLTNGARLAIYSGPTNGSGSAFGAAVEVTNDIVIGENSWLQPNSHPTDGGSVVLRVRNLKITGTTGGINAVARGFAPRQGPGMGGGTGYYGAGGGYGGMGGKPLGGVVYGNPYAPLAPGSGGGGSGDGAPLFTGSGYGGGLVCIQATGNVMLNGQIQAGGGTGTHFYLYGAGGAGGGIFISCNRFIGTETAMLSVKGGNSTNGGAGGGGRIAVWHKRMPSYLEEKLLNGMIGTASVSTNAPVDYLGQIDIGFGTANTTGAEPGTVWFITPPPMGTRMILR